MSSRPILVGASGSEQSLSAVIWAGREAMQRSVPLWIVSVVPSKPGAGWHTARGSHLPTVRQAAADSLEDAAMSANMSAPGLTIDTSLRTGDPGPILAGLGHRASMLVAGSRAAGGPARVRAGSVSRYLVTHAPCPVIIHRDPAAPAQQVVVGVREHADSGAPIAFAFEEAAHRGAHLLAVQAWHWLPPAASPARDSPFTPAELSARALTRLYRLLEPWQDKYPEVEVGEEIIHARPWHALASLTGAADLLVLGRHTNPIGGTDAPLGSVTHAVLTHAHGPVAIVPEELGSTSEAG
jgi:nucleotide-binding universal stress UspA family protein